MEHILDNIIKDAKPENRIFVDLNLDIREQILDILSRHPKIKTQKQLATALGKKDSEISRVLSGLQNLTLETIAKLQAVLEQEIIMTDLKARKKYLSYERENIILSVQPFEKRDIPDKGFLTSPNRGIRNVKPKGLHSGWNFNKLNTGSYENKKRSSRKRVSAEN